MLRVFIVLLVTFFSSVSWARLETRDFAEMDRYHISLLLLAEQESRAAIDKFKQLKQEWSELKEQGADVDEALRGHWKELVKQVDEQLVRTKGLISDGQWIEAQEVLNHMAENLKKYRGQVGLDYYLDYLDYFYETAQPMVQAAHQRMEERRPISMDQVFKKYFAEADSVWSVVKKSHFDPESFGLSPARESQRQEAIKAMDKALYQVVKAYRYGSGEDVARAMLHLEKAYRDIYTLFSDLNLK